MVLCPWYIYFPSILWEMRKPIADDGQNVRLFANNVRMIKPPYIKWCVKSSFFSRFTLLFRTGPSALLLIPSTFYYYCGLVFLPCLLKKGLISRHSKIVKCCVTTLWHQKIFKTEKYFYVVISVIVLQCRDTGNTTHKCSGQHTAQRVLITMTWYSCRMRTPRWHGFFSDCCITTQT